MSTDFCNEDEFDVLKWFRSGSDIDNRDNDGQSPTRTTPLPEQLTPDDFRNEDEFDVSKWFLSDIDDRDNDGQSPTRTTPLPEQPTPDGNSDLNQKIGRVLRNLCGGRNGPLLVQFWAVIMRDGLFSFKTQISHSFIVTADDALGHYWATCLRQNTALYRPVGVSTLDFDCNGTALASLYLPVYLLVREQGWCGQLLAGVLEIVSYTKETCLQFFKETRVCDLFQKEGLTCLDVVPEHLGTQLDVSTQGSEVPSNVSVDHTKQFTHEGVFNSKHQLVTWARDVGEKNAFAVVTKSSDDNRVYLRCNRHGQTRTKKRNGQTRTKERNGQTRTKKCDCPFEIRGHKSKENGTWSLKVFSGFHNHQMQTI